MNIPFIGPYLGPRFNTHSFWPVGHGFPIHSNQELLDFLNSRRNTPNLKKNIYIWLETILENQRSNICIDNTFHANPNNLYYARKTNKTGWNSTILFLRQNLTNTKVVNNLPSLKRNRVSTYYSKCR
jgi:hypothetical protein